MHALIVDDEHDNHELLREILEDLGLGCDHACCIDEAVEQVSRIDFDVVLMDLQIPRTRHGQGIMLGGLDAAQEIHAKLGNSSLPIIAVTCKDTRELQLQIAEAGICYTVEKSTNLAGRIHQALTEVLSLPATVQAPSPPDVRLSSSMTHGTSTVRDRRSDSSKSTAESNDCKASEPQLESNQTVGRSKSERSWHVHDEEPLLTASGPQAQYVIGASVQRDVALASGKVYLEERLSDSGIPAVEMIKQVPDAASETLVPTTLEELRCQVLEHCHRAAQTLMELVAEAVDTDRSPEFQLQIQLLQQALNRAMCRLDDFNDGPVPGETHGHWIVNRLVSATYQAGKLIKLEQQHNFGKWSQQLDLLKQSIDRGIGLGKSDLAQVRQPTLAIPAADEPDTGAVSTTPMVNPSSEVSEVIAVDLVQPPESVALVNVTGTLDELPPLPAATTGSARRLVLIVDDETDARRDLEDKLKRLQYSVISCDTAPTALIFLEALRFDVCLVDLDMPEINGLELIERVRRSRTSANASIIVVSGSAEKFAAADAIEKGADDYLEKPADERLLKARIQSCLRQSDARLAELGKFLPRDVLEHVLSNQNLLEAPTPADVSVMVCDIRGFSKISERVGPVQTINWISEVMNRLSHIILHSGGTIVDYVGDEIMAMWGAPLVSQTHATEACICALDIQKASEELSEKWFPILNSELKIGIGINSGLAVVGNTGSKHRIKYGPLGNTVNLASRVQGATKYLHSSVLITQGTASRIENSLKGRRICSVRVQNINEPVQLFELSRGKEDCTKPSFVLYKQALDAFERKELSNALVLLAKLLSVDPLDGPAKLLMMRVIQSQLGGEFDPTWTLPGK